MEKILTQRFGIPNASAIDVSLANGGYATLKKLFTMQPAQVIEEVKLSGLRGRGGAGFPTGVKWGFVPQNTGRPIYLCVNADEGEPGTFKDRALIEKDPHLLIEGIICTCFALNCHIAYIYVRGEFYNQIQILQKAIDEAYAKGFLGARIAGHDFKLDVYIHRGAGAYICGEETALIESIEGKKGQPRIKPPFPAVVGLFGCPTVVNNVETLMAVPYIIDRGGAAYAKIGVGKSTGTKLWSVSGHVNTPGVYEIPLGMPFAEFLGNYLGGVWNGHGLKAVIMGGSSVPVLTAKEAMKVNLDYESLAASGTMLGSGGMIILDETTCMVTALKILGNFYHHESCGQCTPCREGCGWIDKMLSRMVVGEMRPGDCNLLVNIAGNMQGKTICVFSDALAMPVRSYIQKFRHEFEEVGRLGLRPEQQIQPWE